MWHFTLRDAWKPGHQLRHLAIHLSQMCHTPLGLDKRVCTWSQSKSYCSSALWRLPSLTTGTSVPNDLFHEGATQAHSLAQAWWRVLTGSNLSTNKISSLYVIGFLKNIFVISKTIGLIERCFIIQNIININYMSSLLLGINRKCVGNIFRPVT